MTTQPAEFDTLRDFVNSKSFHRGVDQLADPATTPDWLVEHGLVGARPSMEAADVTRLIELREAIRSALLAHHEREEDAEAVRALDALAGDIPMRVTFGDDGRTRLEPAAEGVDEALGRILAIVHRAVLEGTWPRMKVCPADDCLWAFYDKSKNRSGKWCDMAECGNRAKARAYRARHSHA